ncbi:RNA deprotection pyrophosphohydrolase [Oikeobacillus pervagus]|nr:nucleoside triphosphatase YtkD [Oikeobacillus pervagus]
MKYFTDMNGNEVILSFEPNHFQLPQKHVFVFSQYQHDWLLTHHSIRGLEFPGGKVEKNETIKEAAIREVYEETGGKVEELVHIGDYYVKDPKKTFVKAIFFAKISELDKKDDYLETDGPVYVSKETLPFELQKEQYSFIMKDDVVPTTLRYLKEKGFY